MTSPSSDLQATQIFTAALELPPQDRPRYLDGACAGNPALRAKVEALLGAYPQAKSLFKHLGEAADLAAEDVARNESGTTGAVSKATTESVGVAEAKTSKIGRYRILERIGEGGFGEVFIAQQTEPVKRRVALKVLKAGMDTKSVLARFEAERQALAMMDHPNIAKVLDAGETEQGRPYFVMDLVEGEPITKYCDRHTLSTRDRLELFIPVCRAVQHAHQKGIIHRDLKPSNVLVMLTDGKPTPKVIDFGIAKATSASLTDKTLHTMQGQLIGTPAYMSPEQAEMGALDVDTRTDIYSLGVVLYELLAGSLPFDPESLRKAGYAEIQRILRQQDPPKPSTKVSTLGEESTEVAKRRHTDVRTLRRQLRGELDWITLRAMEKDRTRRYETPNSLAMDIGRYLADEPVLAGPPSAIYRARKFAKRNKVGIGVVVAILVAVTGALIQSNIQRVKIEEARDESEAVTGFLSEMLSSANPGQHGKDVTVLEIMEEAAKTIGERFANQPLVEARLRHTMGDTYRALGEYGAAEEQLEQAIEIRRRRLGTEHVETLRSMHSLAWALGNEGRREDSESLLVQIVELQRRVLGEENRETLGSMSLLAMVYRDQGRYAQSESLLVQTLAKQRRVLGEEDPGLLASIDALARLYLVQGRLDEAESLFRTLLATQRRLVGTEHPRTLKTMVHLSLVHGYRSQYDEAESLLVQTLTLQRRVLGDEHDNTLFSMFYLADLYRQQGQPDEAESLLVQTLTTQRRVLGEENPYTLSTMSSLAEVRQMQGRHKEAQSLFEDVLETRRRVLGDEHGQTLQSMFDLGALYQQQGRFEEAESLFIQNADGWRRVLGPERHNTLTALTRLALLYKEQGRLDKAESLLVQLVETQRGARGEDDPGLLRSMSHLAHVYHQQGKHEEAEPLYLKALEGRRRVHGPSDHRTQWTMEHLIDFYASTGRADEAHRLTEETLKLLKEAAEEDGSSARAKNSYAWILLTCELPELRNPEEGVRVALAACEQANFEDPDCLDTLALAYHLTGQTDKAIETKKRAITVLGQNQERADYEERLAEYEAAAEPVGPSDPVSR